MTMKTVLITGGSRGIGAATAAEFGKNGYRVLLTYKNSESAAKELQSRLNAAGGDVHIFRCDMADTAQIAGLFKQIKTYMRRLDVLVNNVGISFVGTVEELDENALDDMWRTNALSAYTCCRYGLDLLRKSDKPSVLNVSSVWGVCGASCEVGYSMTKHALVGLTKSLAEEWMPSGIAVNCVCPPIVRTDMCAHLTEDDVADFCAEHDCRAYTAAEVASDIYALATSGESGIILEEK